MSRINKDTDNYNKDRLLITNIQRFSLHDGPGIRTTVFLKGCSIHCPWCSNPENLAPFPQTYTKDGNTATYGYYIAPEELVEILLRDKEFYTGKLNPEAWNVHNAEDIEMLPGGVTFSGGEPLLQAAAMKPVLKQLHNNGIHTAIETALFVPRDSLEHIIDEIDLFYVDLKIVVPEHARNVLDGDTSLYIDNLEYLLSSNRPVIIRIPVIAGITDRRDTIEANIELLKRLRDKGLVPVKIELLKGHDLGNSKYISLGLPIPAFCETDDQLLERYRTKIEDNTDVRTDICRI